MGDLASTKLILSSLSVWRLLLWSACPECSTGRRACRKTNPDRPSFLIAKTAARRAQDMAGTCTHNTRVVWRVWGFSRCRQHDVVSLRCCSTRTPRTRRLPTCYLAKPQRHSRMPLFAEPEIEAIFVMLLEMYSVEFQSYYCFKIKKNIDNIF